MKQLTTVQGFALAAMLSAVLWAALIAAGYVVSGWVTR